MRYIFLMTVLTLMSVSASTANAGGDVFAYLSPDRYGYDRILTIVGDHQGNEIRITEDAQNHVFIEGLNGTTINGMPGDEFFSEWNGLVYVSIDLGNGDDQIEYVFTGQEQSSHSTLFSTGQGDDEVTVQVSGFVENIQIDTGVGNDTATLLIASDTWIFGRVKVNTGLGDDAVFFMADNSEGIPRFSYETWIDTAAGNDEVYFGGRINLLDGYNKVFLGSGDDLLVGDSETEAGKPVDAQGGTGVDIVLNALYFGLSDESWEQREFEVIIE